MKTKLLKKVRKQFSIIYYPKGESYYDPESKYRVIDNNTSSLYNMEVFFLSEYGNDHIRALQAAKDWILDSVKRRYYRLGRKRNLKNFPALKVKI